MKGSRAPSARGDIGPLAAGALYAILSLIATWPLAAGLTRDIPWDLGDSLLNAWILAWDAEHLRRVFSGDLSALGEYWNANIFHPEPLTLAYSEHLFAQAVQMLPIYAASGNIILGYNFLFLSTFVLSGLGMFLLVRDLSGSPRAALVAGVVYAFAPYRVPQFAHLQVLSSQWMPMALFALRRYFVRVSGGASHGGSLRTTLALAGAAAALVSQNLSNGYYLLFFAPFVAAYVAYEMAVRRLWNRTDVWAALAVTMAIVVAATLPFLMPYLELRARGVPPRPLEEILRYSADVYSYLTAPPESHVWGDRMRAMPRPEGDLFIPLTALLLAGFAALSAVTGSWTLARSRASGRPALTAGALMVAAVALSLVVMLLAGHRIDAPGFSVRTLGRPSLIFTGAMLLVAAVSPRWRAFIRHVFAHPAGFSLLLAAAAFLLSLGPELRSGGRVIGETGPYGLLYEHVPGFDGLRVPARYAMLVLLFVSIAAGMGASLLDRRRLGAALVLFAGAAAFAEGFAAPIDLNSTGAEGRFNVPPGRVYPAAQAPAVYNFVKQLPRPGTVLVEFPFGETTYEVRYVFYSTTHWHPLLNGYSGTFPLSYSLRTAVLRDPLASQDEAWTELVRSGATHAIVHRRLYRDGEGARLEEWLIARGGRRIADFGGEAVIALR